MIDGSAINAASQWLMALSSGSLAVTLMVLAIMGIGIAMLAGRMEFHRAGRVLIGCFLIFGAGTLAAQLLDMGRGPASEIPVSGEIFRPDRQMAAKPQQANPPQNYDPYAGAALPENR